MTFPFQSGLLADFIRMHAYQAVMQITWHFDMLFSFAIAFAFAYGALVCMEKIFPPSIANRPRVWAIPLLFALVMLAYFLFADAIVSAVLLNLQEMVQAGPDEWVIITAACVWLLGFAIAVFRSIAGFAALSKAAHALPHFSGGAVAQAASAAVGLGAAVAIKCGSPGTPIVSCGLWRPCIVVPDNFAVIYSDEEQHAILVHECIHIKNRDIHKLFVLSLLNALFWFDPVARHAVKRMKADIEFLCDWHAVNTYGLDPGVYANLIVTAASDRRQPAPAFSATFRFLANRLSRILRDPTVQAPARVSRRGASFALVGLVALAVAASIFYQRISPPPPFDPHSDKLHAVVSFKERNGVFAHYVYSRITDKSAP